MQTIIEIMMLFLINIKNKIKRKEKLILNAKSITQLKIIGKKESMILLLENI